MNVGIDRIAYYCPEFCYEVENLANYYGLNYKAIFRSCGQLQSSIKPADEDIVSFGINAARQIIRADDKFDFVIFCTESSFDDSKSAGLYLTEYLNINSDAIFVEMKQACYSSTAALILALSYIKNNQAAKVLIIASDVAKYEPGTNGELTNGCGAIAMILSSNPNVMQISLEHHSAHRNEYDFFKPKELDFPVVDGALSVELYLSLFKELLSSYAKKQQLCSDLILVSHLPFSGMLDKVNILLRKDFNCSLMYKEEIKKFVSLCGNMYTASMYLSILSLLLNVNDDLSNKDVLLFAYGSGTMATILSGCISPNYKKEMSYLKDFLSRRKIVSYKESLSTDLLCSEKNLYKLDKIDNFKRFYKVNE